MNNTDHTDPEISDIMSGWCCPEEVADFFSTSGAEAGAETGAEEGAEEGCDCGVCSDPVSLQSALNMGFYDYESDSEDSSLNVSPSVRSESASRETPLKHRKVRFDYSESGWTETPEEVCEEYRMDPYDYEMYTKSEFYEWYGSHTLWDISHPEKQYKRDLIWECVERGKKMHLSDSMIKAIINKSLKIR
jgi:hypothetical protein